MNIINQLEQMLCPHDHHRTATGEIQCCMCGHIHRRRRPGRRRALVLLAALWLLVIATLATLIVEAA